MKSASLGTALIVDNDPTNHLILESVLNQYNYRIIQASNGQDAIDQYHQEKPDIIFMDVKLSVVDGYEATLQIKTAAGSDFVPILLLTEMNDEKSITRCIDVGGDDFMVKPCEPFLLKTKIPCYRR
mgnify:CR=1 FL=1